MPNNDQLNRRARVFMSCGQDHAELKTAEAVRERLRRLGFLPWLALNEQALRGIHDNTFEQLRRSEYFLFVDFKRGRAGGRRGNYHRSMFSHQELAVAAFLRLPIVAFREEGIDERDGILPFLQVNARIFSDRQHLPDLVEEEVRNRQDWVHTHRNELIILPATPPYLDARTPRGDPLATSRYFHLAVHNRSELDAAHNCFVYLAEARRVDSSATIPLHTIELKWMGWRFPSVLILPRQHRHFDALCVDTTNSSMVQFCTYADSNRFQPRLEQQADYELTYAVASENFPMVRATFRLTRRGSLGAVGLTPVLQTDENPNT
jgi:hypothetical protein